ncbi:hypothetical protein L1887_52809 [Cichorium endivia]|nr:hypothetical protein L1887_52809 [Cichorium endivia]
MLNQMQAGSQATNNLPNSLQTSAAASGLHHAQPSSTWYNDFDSWSMYDHSSMVNQMNAAASQSVAQIPTSSALNSSLNSSLNQASHVHHGLPMQQHHLSSNGMFPPVSSSSLNSLQSKQAPQFNQTNGNGLPSPHSQPITPIPQHHSSSPSIQHASQYSNQAAQFAANGGNPQSSFVSPQKQNNGLQISPQLIQQRSPSANKQPPMPPPSPGPQFSNHSVNQTLLKSDLEKTFEAKIQKLDDRYSQS